MRISFDLDDTLICYQKEVPSERGRIPFFLKPWINEPLRQGAPALMAELKRQGWEVCVCTSSYRSPMVVRLWLACYGIFVGRVINQDTYEAHLRRYPDPQPPSKNPRLFGIHLHIDDSEGVKREGEQYGFDVCVVSPEDANWTQSILEVARRAMGESARRGVV
ncbi:MAG TPA: hypothetical protein VKU00_16150 [Chthonomonadaceae bacterium]|nr:hypothetical protein [Chthonomonadaceae bacterium]